MKAVLISISPKLCELIASGKKTVEVRKTAPKLETPFKCYIYCTKKEFNKTIFDYLGLESVRVVTDGQGMVIGEFVCDEINTLNYENDWSVEPPQEGYFLVKTPVLDFNPCLTNKELIAYGKKKPLYGWHISDLKIYDKPKEIGHILTRPPQSWCYVEN